MKEEDYKASITIETTYISVFVFFSIIFLVYFTLSMYGVSILTSRAYYILERNVSEDVNQEIQENVYQEALKGSKIVEALNCSIKTNVKTEFNEISIDYFFEAPGMYGKENGNVQKMNSIDCEILASCKRERIQESIFALKVIRDGLGAISDNLIKDVD